MKKFIILMLIIITSILFFSCDMESMEGKGTLVIRLPGESGSARMLTQREKDNYLSELKYSIVCSGPASMIKRDANAGDTISLNLASGKYNITVTITNKYGRVIGSETKTETVEAGEEKSVNFKIDLDEPYYFIENEYPNHLKEIAYEWTIGWHTINLEKYNYTKKIVDNNTYIFNIKGHSNIEIHDIIASIWLYTGKDLINRDDDNMHWLGNSTEESIINIDKDKDFDITFEVTAYLDGLTPTALNYLNDPSRISLNLSKKVDAIEEQNKIMAAITHFNMTVKESLSFDMVVWSGIENSGWSSGHDSNTPIYVVNEYLPSIKSNTVYKITAKGHSNAEMKNVEGQFQLGRGYINATNHDNGTTKVDSISGDFEVVFYVATNNVITNLNQDNVIFNLTSNFQSGTSNEAGTVKATITRFSMTIEELRSGENGLIFKLNDEGSGYTVKGSAATKGAVIIPDRWNETINSIPLPVTEIATNAFKKNINITSVTIGNNVKIIGDWAFDYTGTTSVTIGEKVEIIGEDAFCHTKLTSVTIPDSVEIIKKGAFFELHLSSVVISKNSNLKNIGQWAFVTNDITNILIPANVEIINEAFENCRNLTSVIIMAEKPPSIIGAFTWSYNNKLSFHVPEGSLDAYQQHLDWGGRYGAERFYAIETANTVKFRLSEYLAYYGYGNDEYIYEFEPPLQKESSSIDFTVVDNGINITNRSEQWHGLYISIDVPSLMLFLDTYKYRITVTGNLFDPPYPNSGIAIQGADDPYTWIRHENTSSKDLFTVTGEIPSDFLTRGNRQILICTTYETTAVDFRINSIEIVNLGLISGDVLPPLTGTVDITGTAQVGQTLRANTSSVGGSGAISYQWKRGNINVGTNSSNYTVQAEDAGSDITVTVTRSGYSGSLTSRAVTVQGGGSNSVDWNSSSNYSIRISNYSSTDIIAFKDSINENNILGGIRAKSDNHGIKKDLFPPTPAQIIVYFITRERYEANAGNLSGLQNMIFTQIVVYWNGNDGDNSRVYNLSEKLGGNNSLQIMNSLNYDVEFRVGGIAGHTLIYVPQGGKLIGNIYIGEGEYKIYPVFQRYNPIRDIIETVILTYSSGNPYRYEVNFAPGSFPQTLTLNLQDAILSATQQSPVFVSVVIKNDGTTGVNFYKEGLLMKTPSGKQTINFGEVREFIFDMPITENSFSDSLLVGDLNIKSLIGNISIIDQNGDPDFYLKAGKRYTITVTDDMYDEPFIIDTSNPDDLEFDLVNINLLN